jgi:hypothetical protein
VSPTGVAWLQRIKWYWKAAFFVLLSWFVALLINGFPPVWKKPLLTYTAQGRTEAIEAELSAGSQGDRRQSWLMPPGAYTTADDAELAICGSARQPSGSCKFQGHTVLRVNGVGRVRIEVAGHGLILIVSPVAGQALETSVLDEGNHVVVHSKSILTFESRSAGAPVRMPLVLASATIGASLYEAVEAMGPGEGGSQPILLEGSYSLIAGASDIRQRYGISQEPLGRGDILQMRPQQTDPAALAAMAGMVSVSADREAIDFSLSMPVEVRWRGYSANSLRVQRAGTTTAFDIGIPSRFVIAGHGPAWQTFWWTFLAIGGFIELMLTWRAKLEPAIYNLH